MISIPKFTRHLTLLLIAQAISGSAGPVLFLVSGLLGPTLAPTLALTTLPMSLVVIGIAVASPLASWTMSRIGRKHGHLLGLSLTFAGTVTACIALMKSNFSIYCVGNTICGAGAAFNNQIRFTAAEKAGDQKALVHSWVLMFSLFAAILGPWIAEHGRDLLHAGPYTGSLVILAAMIACLMLLLLWLPSDMPVRLPPGSVAAHKISKRAVLSQPKFWLGACSGTASFATMTLLMSATPLQMHEISHFTSAETTSTIQSHIVAMFLPSLFSGVLLSYLGVRKLITLGVVIFAVCIGLAYQSSHFHHYWWALVLLGVGWNFLFLASSTWISQSFSGPERFVAQGANDLFVYGTQSLASLAAGGLLFAFGWKVLVLIPLPFLVGLLIFMSRFFGQAKKPRDG